MSHSSFGPAGAHPSGAGCSWPLRTIYKCTNVKTEDSSIFINAGRGRPFRAPGHVQGTFGLESAMDMLAEKVGMDPLDFRLKNYAENDQVYNRLVWAFPDGSYKTYNKRHLFSFAGEDKVYRAGTERLIIDCEGWRV